MTYHYNKEKAALLALKELQRNGKWPRVQTKADGDDTVVDVEDFIKNQEVHDVVSKDEEEGKDTAATTMGDAAGAATGGQDDAALAADLQAQYNAEAQDIDAVEAAQTSDAEIEGTAGKYSAGVEDDEDVEMRDAAE